MNYCPPNPTEQVTGDTRISDVGDRIFHDKGPVTKQDLGTVAYAQAVAFYESLRPVCPSGAKPTTLRVQKIPLNGAHAMITARR